MSDHSMETAEGRVVIFHTFAQGGTVNTTHYIFCTCGWSAQETNPDGPEAVRTNRAKLGAHISQAHDEPSAAPTYDYKTPDTGTGTLNAAPDETTDAGPNVYVLSGKLMSKGFDIPPGHVAAVLDIAGVTSAHDDVSDDALDALRTLYFAVEQVWAATSGVMQRTLRGPMQTAMRVIQAAPDVTSTNTTKEDS